jgi:hypothetical protein
MADSSTLASRRFVSGRRVVRQFAAALSVAPLLSGCGGGRIVCGATPITDIHANGVSGPIAWPDPIPPPPSSWTTRTRGQLTVLAPPAEPDSTWVIDTPEADGTTCVTWNGRGFGQASEAGELGEVDVKHGHDISELVDVTAQGFAALPLSGADQAVARIVQEPFRDGGGALVPHERATGLEAVIVAREQVYRVSVVLEPGSAGVIQGRQILAALRLG